MTPFLALLLIGPWLAVLGWAYWAYPRSLPRTGRRRLFDVVALVLATASAVRLTLFGYASFGGVVVDRYGRHSGAIWQQVAPALYAYGGFAVVLLVALLLRAALWRRR